MFNEVIFQPFYLLFYLLVFLIPKYFVIFFKKPVYSVKGLNFKMKS